jgi:Holliday junction resolvase-like predicted endonuclease
MSNYLAGHSAEKRAAEYLTSKGFRVLELNWKTKYCEIDVVAEKAKHIYFVEVKYRRNNKQGFGLEYILPKKLQQMRFAAEMWVSNHGWKHEYQLAAISIDAEQITFIDDINL